MQEDFTVPLEYVRAIAEQLRSMGVNVTDWLAQNELTEAELLEFDRMLPFPAFRRLVLSGLDLARDPAIGLFVGARLVASTHGVVGAVAINSSTVRQALDMIERFSRLRSSIITISHDVGAHKGRVLFHEPFPLGEIQRPVLEAVVLSIRNVLDEVTMGTCQVLDVAFPFEAPEYAAVAADMFRCKVRYGQDWTGFTAPRTALDLPLKLADPAAFEEAQQICQRELESIAAQESMSARVRRLLLENQTGFPSLQVAAHVFHMAPRTLHRRLVDEGTSFRDLVESVRHTLAVEHLKSNRFSIEELAYRLGYTDLANFRRAFKRWEGVAPAAYREKHTAERKDS